MLLVSMQFQVGMGLVESCLLYFLGGLRLLCLSRKSVLVISDLTQ